VAWWSLLLNLGVVAWGAYLRAMQFGDGCGTHWPLCEGNPDALHGHIATLVEYSHRASAIVPTVFGIVLIVLARRQFPRGAQQRKLAYIVASFVLLEALIGAVLVLFKLVTTNPSTERVAAMSFHVVSTFLLMAATTWAAYTGTGRKLKLKGQGPVGWFLALGFAMIGGLGVSGAISALAHTLDPVKDVLSEAMKANAFWMVKVQPYHPYISLAVGMFLVLTATLVGNLRPGAEVRRAAIVMVGAFLIELGIGLSNILLNAPVWLQMIHLAAADATVVTFAYFAACALREGVERREQYGASDRKLSVKATAKQYFMLTKPRVISLLLFTTVAALLAAAGGWPGLTLVLSVTVGGYMMAGAANTMNMVVERDLDQAMARTRTRPTVNEDISGSRALGFGLAMAVGAFTILTVGANLLAACLALAGLVFYVSIYTLALKRRTWNNIVIGGAAGAFPPLVGWAAAHNGLAPLAYYLFAIVFLWTPVHFWALAILIKDDYAAAGVPMLPVVKGVRATTVQIAVYTVLTVMITFAPVLFKLVGWPYAVTAIALNVYLALYCSRLFRNPDRARASGLFHYSMVYLALLFVAVAVDRSLPHATANRVQVISAPIVPVDGQSNVGARDSQAVRVGARPRPLNYREGIDATAI
jgi:protoheme IX farnesyltransferase